MYIGMYAGFAAAKTEYKYVLIALLGRKMLIEFACLVHLVCFC